MIGLYFLKHALYESDESAIARWVENPYGQYFCRFTTMQHELPLHSAAPCKWRGRVEAEKLALRLRETIATALRGQRRHHGAGEKHHAPDRLEAVLPSDCQDRRSSETTRCGLATIVRSRGLGVAARPSW